MSAESDSGFEDARMLGRCLTAPGTAAGSVLAWLNSNRLRPVDPHLIAKSIRRPKSSVLWGLQVLALSGLLSRMPLPLSLATSPSGWLRNALRDGALHATEVEARARRDHIPWKAVQRAAVELGVCRQRIGFGGKVFWSLPLPSDHR